MGRTPAWKKKNIWINLAVGDFGQLTEITQTVSLWHFYVLHSGINSLCAPQISVHCIKAGFFRFKLLKMRHNPAFLQGEAGRGRFAGRIEQTHKASNLFPVTKIGRMNCAVQRRRFKTLLGVFEYATADLVALHRLE